MEPDQHRRRAESPMGNCVVIISSCPPFRSVTLTRGNRVKIFNKRGGTDISQSKQTLTRL